MLKIRFFSFLFLIVSLFYGQQNKLSIEAEASIYSNWNTYFSYNLISAIDNGESVIYFASYNSIWIIFGIVGSRNFKVGELIQIDKITSSDFQDNYYPSPSAFKNNNIERCNLITVNKPEKLFENDGVYDMEGYGFFSFAKKIASHELISVLKIISDIPGTDLSKIDKHRVEILVSKQIQFIEKVLENLLALQKILILQLRDPKYFDEICLQKKFTFSQKVTLRKYLTQWQARFPLRNPLDEIRQKMTASQILKKFSDNLLR